MFPRYWDGQAWICWISATLHNFSILVTGQTPFLVSCHATTTSGAAVMNEPSLLNQNCCNHTCASEQIPEALNLHKRILQTERDQVADEVRIDDAITRAENEIARLQQRQLAFEQLQAAIIRDRTILIVRDVRKNMQRRSLAAKRMEECLNDDFLRQRSRFARDNFEDEELRRKLLQLLQRTPTSGLIEHLHDAVEAGNFACAELIRFEFQCRDDRDEFRTGFEAMVEKLSRYDPVEMCKRLTNIEKATERVDARITLLQRAVRSSGQNMSAVA
jgi:hypothetical protein